MYPYRHSFSPQRGSYFLLSWQYLGLFAILNLKQNIQTSNRVQSENEGKHKTWIRIWTICLKSKLNTNVTFNIKMKECK